MTNALTKRYRAWREAQKARKALVRWLIYYTWEQADGTFDFSHPRVRPMGMDINPFEAKLQYDPDRGWPRGGVFFKDES